MNIGKTRDSAQTMMREHMTIMLATNPTISNITVGLHVNVTIVEKNRDLSVTEKHGMRTGIAGTDGMETADLCAGSAC
jgi:hypothetical protein